MKKRNMSILLITVILCVQILSSLGVAYATEGDEASGYIEITATAELDSPSLESDNKYFVAAMSRIKMSYTVKVEGYEGKKLAIVEKITDKHSETVYSNDIDIEENEKDGNPIIKKGQQYKIDQEPLTFEYYVINKSDGTIEKHGGTIVFEPKNVDFKVTYASDKSGSVFKNDQVTFTVTVKSESNVPVENIIVRDEKLGELGRIDTLAPGSVGTITKTFKMEKGTDGVIILSYSDPLGIIDEESKRIETKTVSLNVSNAPRSSGISIESVPDINAIPGETTVNIALIIKNIGNTNLNNIKVIDWNGETVYSSQGPLTPGEEVTRNYTAKVKPDTTYKVRAEAEADATIMAIGDAQFILSKLDPRIEILRDIPTGIVAGEPFEIKYTIRNIGNVDIKNILIEEPEMGDVAVINELLSGDEIVKTKEFTIEDNVVSKTKLKAVDSLSGSEYEYSASDMVINVQSSGVKHQLAMVLHANTESLKDPGTINLECIVKNTGTEALNNLKFVLMDREMMIKEIIVLEPGEEQRLVVTPFRLEQTEDFKVVVNGYGSDNTVYSAESDTVTITVENPGKVKNPSVFKTILVIIALLCLLIIGTLVYMSKDSIKKWFNKIRKTA